MMTRVYGMKLSCIFNSLRIFAYKFFMEIFMLYDIRIKACLMGLLCDNEF